MHAETQIFDREIKFDPRSRSFPISTTFTHNKIRSYTWKCEAWNDQGREGACVGFAWSHELTARPVEIKTSNEVARQIYIEAQKLDQWAGEDYEGTSVIAGVKAVRALYADKDGNPLIAEYRWAFSLEDIVRTLGFRGPIVLGMNWYSGMFNTDANGFIRKTGFLAGGHAILARGVKIVWLDKKAPKVWSNVDRQLSYVVLRNSWGKAWGDGGDAKISLNDLNALMREQGEACVPVVRKKGLAVRKVPK
jgi:hypothetical protein